MSLSSCPFLHMHDSHATRTSNRYDMDRPDTDSTGTASSLITYLVVVEYRCDRTCMLKLNLKLTLTLKLELFYARGVVDDLRIVLCKLQLVPWCS